MFLENQLKGGKNEIHLAVVCLKEQKEEFIGVLSLKNINWIDRNAEFAIVLVNKKYIGSGVAKPTTVKLLEYAFKALNMKNVYLSVLKSNERAKRFYEKNRIRKRGRFSETCFHK